MNRARGNSSLKMDAEISALKERLEKSKKQDIKQGTMQELLTGKTRLPGFSDEWQNTFTLNDWQTLLA